MFVLNGLVCTVSDWASKGSISPVVDDALLRLLNQVLDQVMGGWAMFLAVLGDLRTFAITSVSIDVLGVAINALVLASLFYLIVVGTRMAAGMVGERA